jgi:hypothetical protein
MSDSFIYTPSKNTTSKNDDKFYGIIQDYDFVDKENNPRINLEKDPRVLAKIKYKADGKEKFLIRIDNSKKLFNPSLPLSENKRDKLLEQYGADSSCFKEVSQRVFDYYVTFLRTANQSWIHNAEREDF